MADVDMTDAPSGSSSAPAKKIVSKGKAAQVEGGADGKKRFEVKKVCDIFV
jgi:RING-box protein 1